MKTYNVRCIEVKVFKTVLHSSNHNWTIWILRDHQLLNMKNSLIMSLFYKPLQSTISLCEEQDSQCQGYLPSHTAEKKNFHELQVHVHKYIWTRFSWFQLHWFRINQLPTVAFDHCEESLVSHHIFLRIWFFILPHTIAHTVCSF